MRTLIYKYLPRFTTGLFLITPNRFGGIKFRLLTGQVQYPTQRNHYIAEVQYLNLLGLVLNPTIIAILRK